MQPSDRQLPYVLSDRQNQAIYEIVKNDLLEPLKTADKQPVAFFLAGQPGSGKTILRNHLLGDTNIQRSTLVINTDELREYHPAYRELLADPVNFASAPYLVNPDSVKWAERLRTDAIKGGYNLLFDVTLGGNHEHYVNSMNELKALNYKVYVAVLAVKPELSRLGIHLRYERQLEAEGSGRFVNMDVHNKNYKMLTENLGAIMKAVDLDAIAVYKRKVYEQGDQLLNNAVESIVGTDKSPKNHDASVYNDVIIDAITKERDREWTNLEKDYLKIRIDQVEQLLKNRGGDLSVFKEDIKDLIAVVAEDHRRGQGR